MKMEYVELKSHFAEFHAGNLTKTELVAAIGLYQEMNHIVTTRRVNGYRIISDGKRPQLLKVNYFPKNISPRIIGNRHDADYEYEKGKKAFFNTILGESYQDAKK